MPSTFRSKENFRQQDAWLDGAGSETVPTITLLNPATGDDAGGTTVTVTGTNLAAVTGVTVGGQGASFALVSGTSITFVTPPGTVGAASVVISSSEGPSAASTFTYT